MTLEIVKPNLTAIQTAFTGRLYSIDLFTLYRAVSGKYATYPSIVAGGAGLSIQQDVVTYLGALGPFGRFHYVGDVYSAIYNQYIARDLEGIGVLQDFWPGWDRFTALLLQDAKEVGAPLVFPGLRYTLPKAEVPLPPAGDDLITYIIYRGDVDTMEVLMLLLSQYLPETDILLPVTYKDLEGMFALYGEWVKERFLGEPASSAARVMAKVILLADYRWYLLTGDLLGMADPAFLDAGFQDGIKYIADRIRQEAEAIRVSGA